MGSKTITVKTSEENPEPVELIAKAIIEVSDAFEKINQSRLTNKAIVLLLQDLCGLPQRDIKLVLHNAPLLKKYYLKDAK